MNYDYRTGRWDGKDDSFMDVDGYGHYVGETFEVWFNIYQTDYDHDGVTAIANGFNNQMKHYAGNLKTARIFFSKVNGS